MASTLKEGRNSGRQFLLSDEPSLPSPRPSVRTFWQFIIIIFLPLTINISSAVLPRFNRRTEKESRQEILPALFLSIKSAHHAVLKNYSMMLATRPEPTVRPPSRIAKVSPFSMAIGWISSMVISTLSPGMHISVPSGRLMTPVTSVVRK